jgi:uncharacterized membrane-anchored protein
MTSFQKKGLVLVVILQLAVLSFMIYKRVELLENGKTVRLKCVPIDPRSLFSGDYVILNYTISSFSNEKFKSLNRGEEAFKENETIYVGLVKEEGSGLWDAAEVSHDLGKLRDKYEAVIRGEMISLYTYRIKYGVEEYFVPQHEGKKIEKKIRDVSVEVALSPAGESGIKKLFISNREVKFY